MKKIFTITAVAAMAFSVSAETVILSNPDKLKKNPLVGTELGENVPAGFSLECMKEDKTLDPGNQTFTINGGEYQAIKFSNGAQNTVTLPEGYVATKVTFYTTINKDAATDRPCYWAEVAGTTYTVDDNNGIIESFKDAANPNVQSFDIPELNSFTFKNAGEQPLAVLEITYNAPGQNEPATNVVKSWDFTKWSDATVANLMAGENWSDIEKADATEPTEKSKDNCFWQVSYSAGVNADGFLTANDVVIEELKGLVYTNEKTNRSLAIAVNYPDPDPSKDFGPYHGPAYLWLGSKQINYFVIPGVPAGATIKMGVESHKLTDARGVELSVAGETLMAPDGSAVAVPTTYTEQEWMVPTTAAASNDVQIYNTNGCHIYFITVTAAGGTTGIEAIANDENAPVEYYNIQGVRVANPENGLYIKRQGNKAEKIYVK
ncbi:MAG: hypothetical protein K2H22_01830 [Muribaculaceae bacterium]|nr:hypothetical protein [Muribaculaceae bacterium]